MRNSLTEAEVELEIERLESSPDVRLARKAIAIKNRRRQRMYTLRNLEKYGMKLSSEGVTLENLEEILSMYETEENEE